MLKNSYIKIYAAGVDQGGGATCSKISNKKTNNSSNNNSIKSYIMRSLFAFFFL